MKVASLPFYSNDHIFSSANRVRVIPLLLICFALPAALHAVSPTPDGGYAGGNTAEGGAGALFSLTTGSNNTALGSQALYNVTTGVQNTATGAQALKNNFGSQNTADGFQALVHNTTASGNTANGWRALYKNTTGTSNTAVGTQSLYTNTTASGNTAVGTQALYSNATGSRNTACGSLAIEGTGSVNDDTAVGFGALEIDTGGNNTAVGSLALASNTSANSNTATGWQSLFSNDTGNSNTAHGAGALASNRSGFQNTAVGAQALSSDDGDNDTAIGFGALANVSVSSHNIAVGSGAGTNLTSGSNDIYIGNAGTDLDENTIRIGTQQAGLPHTRAFIAGITGATIPLGTAVVINGNGQLGVATSSARFKTDIKPMENGSETILALRPVTFRYTKDIDSKGTPQFGLVAEEVEKVNQDLVVHDAQGKPYTVRYDAVNAMLLNEFLKAHRKIEEQQDTIAELKSGMNAINTALKEQATEMQAMRAQLPASKAAPQVVANP